MKDMKAIISREYWITQKGEKKYAHEFEDSHLVNTINFLHRGARRHRLEEARNLVNLVHRTGNGGVDVETYYRHYRQQMDAVLGDITDKQWLKENSKIYNLLVEEANYRELDITDKPTKKKYSGLLNSVYSASTGQTYTYSFTNIY